MTQHAILAWLNQYWWVLVLLWWMGVLSWPARALSRALKTRHERRLEIAQAMRPTLAGPPGPAPKPGPCVHRNVVAVMSSDELEPEVRSWLCRSCGAQLPADWAVREEDL